MPRTRPPYPPQFRDRIVGLAEEFEPSGQTMRSWIKKADLEDGMHSGGTTTAEREELREFRKELRRYPSRSATF